MNMVMLTKSVKGRICQQDYCSACSACGADVGFRWSLQNLQPMWCLENISKNNRYAGDFKCLKQ